MFITVLMWIGALFLVGYTVLLPAINLVNVRLLYPRAKARTGRDGFPLSVGVYVPCQGHDDLLEGNLRAIAEQDYPDYTVTFVTDGPDDPAVRAIRSVVEGHPRARHLIAGLADTLCSQQNYVQSVSMGSDTTSDVLVKLDSDIRPRRDWLRDFVRPYEDPGVAATSAHHWISPLRPGFVNGCYTLYSGSLTLLMGTPGLQWIWGGCFGIRRRVYHEVDVDGLWRSTGTDDSTLRSRLVSRRKRIVVVPDCVAVSHDTHEDFRGFVRWIARQGFHGRVYLKGYWVSLLASETAASLWILASFLTLLAAILGWASGAAAAASGVVLASVVVSGLVCKLAYPDTRDIPLSWWALLMFPSHFIQTLAVWKSAFMKSLSWRGHVYRFAGDGRVEAVIREGARL